MAYLDYNFRRNIHAEAAPRNINILRNLPPLCPPVNGGKEEEGFYFLRNIHAEDAPRNGKISRDSPPLCPPVNGGKFDSIFLGMTKKVFSFKRYLDNYAGMSVIK